MILAR
jgi:hypothetical protein